MQTTRIGPYRSPAPTTDYYGGADYVAQSQAGNYSVLRLTATAYNRGGSGSVSNYQGGHTMAADGYGQAQYLGTMPSGVATGGLRWDIVADVAVGHDAAGNCPAVTLRQTVSWPHIPNGGVVNVVGMPVAPRIPKPPSKPGTPVASEILPTSIRLTWTASTDNGGSAIDGYLLRYWPNAAGTGPYTDVSQQNNLTRVATGLTPGQEYRFVVYAHNASAGQYSVLSDAIVVRTLSGAWGKYEGIWRRLVPFIKVAGVWKAVAAFIKKDGEWKRGG